MKLYRVKIELKEIMSVYMYVENPEDCKEYVSEVNMDLFHNEPDSIEVIDTQEITMLEEIPLVDRDYIPYGPFEYDDTCEDIINGVPEVIEDEDDD